MYSFLDEFLVQSIDKLGKKEASLLHTHLPADLLGFWLVCFLGTSLSLTMYNEIL